MVRRPGLRAPPWAGAAVLALAIVVDPKARPPGRARGGRTGLLLRDGAPSRLALDRGVRALGATAATPRSTAPTSCWPARVYQLPARHRAHVPRVPGRHAPAPAALVWFVVFPIAVGYGIVRRQLFDIRGVAKSSAAYGAVTLAITGVFAFLITFADARSRALQRQRVSLVLGVVPVLRDPRCSTRCATACRRWSTASSTATARPTARGARDLRGDGLDALAR